MAERVTVIDGGQAVITAREERIFPVQSIGADLAFHNIAIHLDCAVGQEKRP